MDERQGLLPIPSTWTGNVPVIRQERMVKMRFGSEFFKTLDFVIAMMRMIAKFYGDEDEKVAAVESETREAQEKSTEKDQAKRS